MKAKIFALDLLPYRPYSKTDNIDAYYAHVASRCLEVMEYGNSLGMNEGDRKSCAMMMALYLEDIVSGLGIYQSFTEEMKARYGSYLPFYAITDDTYLHDEINVADVCFMFWHRLQLRATAEGTIVNPLDPNIAFIAESIMTVLDAAYEEAPENTKLQEMMRNTQFGADDFLSMRGCLRWFHYGCYLFAENQLELNGMMAQLQEQAADRNPWQMQQLAYTLDHQLIFNSNRQLLSLTTAEWAAKIMARHTDVALLQDIKPQPIQIYRYAGNTDDDYLFELASEEKTVYEVSRRSIDLTDMLADAKEADGEETDIYISGQLVEYGGKAWVNGLVRREPQEAAEAQTEHLRSLKEEHDKLADIYKNFLDKNDGEWLHFCEKKADVATFLSEKLGYNADRSAQLPPLDDKDGIMIYCTPHSGIGIVQAYTACVAHPKNTFYDQKRAAEEALALLVSPGVVSYEASQMLQAEGFVPDAAMKSILGPDHGRELVENNALFITDYFFHTYAEREEQLQKMMEQEG